MHLAFGCDAPPRWRTSWRALGTRDVHLPYSKRDKGPRPEVTVVVVTCGRHMLVSMNSNQQRVVERTGRVTLPGGFTVEAL